MKNKREKRERNIKKTRKINKKKERNVKYSKKRKKINHFNFVKK